MERYLWKAPSDADPAKVKEELADVFAYAFLLADRYGPVASRENVTEKKVF